MKKVVVVILSLLFPIPLFMGGAAKYYLDRVIDVLNTRLASDVDLQFKWGYLSSTALLNAADGTSVRLDITHGPFLFSDELRFGNYHVDATFTEVPAEYRAAGNYFGEVLRNTLVTLDAGFDRAATFTVSAPSLAMRGTDGALVLDGLEFRVDPPGDGQTTRFSGVLHGLHGYDGTTRYAIAPIRLSGGGRGENGGEFDLVVDDLSVGDDVYKGLTLSVTYENTAPQLLDLSWRLDAAHMAATVEDVHFHATIANLDRDRLMAARLAIFTPAEPTLAQVLPPLDSVFGNGAEIHVDDLSFRNEAGVELHASGSAAFIDGFFAAWLADTWSTNPARQVGLLNTNFTVELNRRSVEMLANNAVDKLIAQLEPSAPPERKAELKQQGMEAYLRSWEQQGMMEPSARGYIYRVRAEDGALSVNEVPVPFDDGP